MKILPKDEPIRKFFTAENNFLTFLEFYQRIPRLSGEYDSSDTKHLLNAFSLKFYHVIRQAKCITRSCVGRHHFAFSTPHICVDLIILICQVTIK